MHNSILTVQVTESIADEETKSRLEALLDIETPLYYNNRLPMEGLINPGPMYSLCGRLQQTRRAMYQVRTALYSVKISAVTEQGIAIMYILPQQKCTAKPLKNLTYVRILSDREAL